jgi:hypothetical protein
MNYVRPTEKITNKQIFNEFVRFVKAHSPKTKINNKNGGWMNTWEFCAGGNFVRNNMDNFKSLRLKRGWEFSDFVDSVMEKIPFDLYYTLSRGDFAKYGSLQTYIKKNHQKTWDSV